MACATRSPCATWPRWSPAARQHPRLADHGDSADLLDGCIAAYAEKLGIAPAEVEDAAAFYADIPERAQSLRDLHVAVIAPSSATTVADRVPGMLL